MGDGRCAICNREDNRGIRLIDGNLICRKCAKASFKCFDHECVTLKDVMDHHEQITEGTKIYEEVKDHFKGEIAPLFVYKEKGLIALVEERPKFLCFIKKKYACMYNLRDLQSIEPKIRIGSGADGKPMNIYEVNYRFEGYKGMSEFTVKTKGVDCSIAFDGLRRYFDSILGEE
ncbi:MAG: hypothetical protein J6U54_22155 [Clostridiales bacterium]|nr:hypothetical protein [Clostridiales bacterium]